MAPTRDTITKEDLFRYAEEALKTAIAPFSSLKVGSALLAKGGRVFTGCNIENPSLMLTICAERVALYKALSEGVKEFEAIAIVSSAEQDTPPCGVCRQLLLEFAPLLTIYTRERSGRINSTPISSLLPAAFRYKREE